MYMYMYMYMHMHMHMHMHIHMHACVRVCVSYQTYQDTKSLVDSRQTKTFHRP